MARRAGTWIFFAMIFAYLFFLGRVGLPLAHDFFDRVVYRDTSTLLPFLLHTSKPILNIAMLAMKHLEGPSHFLLLNLYSYCVGDIFALSPATMQFPNTLLSFCACVFGFLLGKRLFDERQGYCFAMAFVVAPWVALTLRLPWYFNYLSCLLHFSTVYFFARTIVDPKVRLYRVLAPLSLGLYLFTGLDWPSYGLFLFLFVALSGNLKRVLTNPYMIFAFAAGGVLLVWDALLGIKFGVAGLAYSRLAYPFVRASRETSIFSWERVWENTLLPWGPQLLLAIVGIAYYLWIERKRLNSNPVGRAFLDATCLWLGWAGITVIWSSGSPQYLYVLGMPAAVLSGLVLRRLPIKHMVAVVTALVAFQLAAMAHWGFLPKEDEKRRVMAAAAFLIEQRPGLLEKGKTLLAIDSNKVGMGGTAGSVVQYARPQERPFIVPVDFPVTRIPTPGGPPDEQEVRGFLDTYTQRGVIKADAIVMESRAIDESNPARSFWLPLLVDPHIRWIARFAEPGGELFLGEVVESGGIPLAESPRIDVLSLSNDYSRKYDKLSFLQKNVEYVRLFFTSRLTH